MESKLEAYRIRKRRKETFSKIKEKFFKMLPFKSRPNEDDCIVDTTALAKEKIMEPIMEDLPERGPISESEESLVDEELQTHQKEDPSESKYMRYFLFAIYFLFWATCYAIAIELKFGIVYLLFSALFGIYFNTRTGPKSKTEISAYSVFNKDCHAIDGTLNAEQFEREIRYGPGNVR